MYWRRRQMKVGNKVKIQKLARGEILEMSGRDW